MGFKFGLFGSHISGSVNVDHANVHCRRWLECDFFMILSPQNSFFIISKLYYSKRVYHSMIVDSIAYVVRLQRRTFPPALSTANSFPLRTISLPGRFECLGRPLL